MFHTTATAHHCCTTAWCVCTSILRRPNNTRCSSYIYSYAPRSSESTRTCFHVFLDQVTSYSVLLLDHCTGTVRWFDGNLTSEYFVILRNHGVTDLGIGKSTGTVGDRRPAEGTHEVHERFERVAGKRRSWPTGRASKCFSSHRPAKRWYQPARYPLATTSSLVNSPWIYFLHYLSAGLGDRRNSRAFIVPPLPQVTSVGPEPPHDLPPGFVPHWIHNERQCLQLSRYLSRKMFHRSFQSQGDFRYLVILKLSP